jgi:pimeloyl-ACP methyl ester carboxylesterase
MGRAVIPIFNKLRGDCRVSFRVKVDTSLANGRRITVGFAEGSPGVATGGGAKTYEAGYMNKDSGGTGRGIGRTQDNVWGFEEHVANGALVNGREYDISLQFSRYGSLLAGNTNAQIGVRVVDTVDGSVKYQQVILDRTQVPANVVITSNSSTAELSKVRVAMHPLGEIGMPSIARMRYTTQSSSNEYLSVLTPAKPNGRLVIALHGLWEQDLSWMEGSGYATGAFLPMVKTLVDAGYTVAAPLMRGTASNADTAGNLTAQQCVKDAYDIMVNKYGLNRRAYLLGNSAGALTGLIMIETRPFPIAAAYLAEPPVDMVSAWSNTTFKDAWGSNTSLRDQYDPYQRPASDFAGVPMYLLGSSSDTVVPKASHMTAFINNRLNPANPAASRIYWAFDASGAHGDPTHFRPIDLLTLFNSNP